MKYEKDGGQFYPPQKKLPSKNPALLGLKNISDQHTNADVHSFSK